MEFRLWSDTNYEALNNLKPDFGFKKWDNYTKEDKNKIWIYLDKYFFNKTVKYSGSNYWSNRDGEYFDFTGEDHEQNLLRERIGKTIVQINGLYKAQSFAANFLETPTYHEACKDFLFIFLNLSSDVVLELITIYSSTIINEPCYLQKYEQESENKFNLRLKEEQLKKFDEFARDFNEVLSHFSFYVELTRLGFCPKQDEKITKEIYEPVIRKLADSRWKEVNDHLRDAFFEYRKNSDLGFSNCVTNTVSSVQAFLQILINGKTGKGDISKLLKEAHNKNLIPSDNFSQEILKLGESYLMKERQEFGISHPKKSYADEKNARTLMNVAMIFFQHCL